MPAPTDLEKRATQILDNAYWLQGIMCRGCTHRWHDRADIVDGRLVFSEPRCLKANCPGHDPTTAYQKAMQSLVDHDIFQTNDLIPYGLLRAREAADASTE